MSKYFIVDVETVPLDMDAYFSADEEERLSFLNPFDSKLIAVGIRCDGENKIYKGNEKDMLEEFWLDWGAIRQGNETVKAIGFNIKDFDMYMLTGRSFIKEVPIRPFKRRESIVDLQEKLSAYKWKAEGTLEKYANAAGVAPPTENGSKVAKWAKQGNMEAIIEHLKQDLVTTEKLFERARDLNITQVERW